MFIIDVNTLKIKEREKLINDFNAGKITNLKLSWEIMPNIYTTISDDFAFRLVCKSGDLEVAKCLINLWSPLDLNYTFRVACQYGQLHIAKWLYELYPNINIHDYNDFAFIFACYNGHIEVIKWLYELDYDIDNKLDYLTFNYICNKHIELIDLFINLKPNRYSISIDDNNKINYLINKNVL